MDTRPSSNPAKSSPANIEQWSGRVVLSIAVFVGVLGLIRQFDATTFTQARASIASPVLLALAFVLLALGKRSRTRQPR